MSSRAAHRQRPSRRTRRRRHCPSGPTAGTSGPEQTYTVVAGDSLSKIAKRYYGDANKWPRIHEANRDQIKNPDLIHPGQRLRIPGA